MAADDSSCNHTPQYSPSPSARSAYPNRAVLLTPLPIPDELFRSTTFPTIETSPNHHHHFISQVLDQAVEIAEHLQHFIGMEDEDLYNTNTTHAPEKQ
jgi:hypothetical protein